MLQHGAYFTLLNNYYITGGPLPEKTEHLVRICGAHSSEEIEAISFVLSSFFSLKSDGWHNKKADAEIREAKRISTVRRNARLGKRKTIVNQELPVSALHPHPHIQKEEPKTKAASAFAVPDWIPQEEWQSFEEMRRKIRKPMTDKARSLIVTSLHKLRSLGHSPKLVLEQSIRNSWQDVYELKGDSHGTDGQHHQAQPKQHVTAQHQRWASNVRAVAAGYGLSGTGAVDAVTGSAGVGNSDSADRSGQAARPGSGSHATVEGEVKRIL